MTSPLSWSLHGNDQLSGVLERLDRTLGALGKKLDNTTADARGFGRALGDTENPARRMNSRLDESGGRLNTFKGHISGAVVRLRDLALAIGSSAAVAGLGQLVAMGVKLAASNETAAVSFEVILQSAAKAKVFLADLQKFAAATPFEMPQLRTAASRLLAVGTESSHVIPLLTVLGDATAGMGTGAEGIERAVTALTQMRQKTKVTAEEMLQLTEAGIPAWETLAGVLHTDVAGAMKLVEQRKVGAETMFTAIEQRASPALKRLSGMMSRQSATLEGIWSTFKDNAGQALATFVEPAMPAIKKLVDVMGIAVPKVLTGLTSGLKAGGGQIGAIFKDSDVPERVLNSLREMGQKLLPVLRDAWKDIVKTVKDNKEGLEKLGRFIADVAIPIIGVALAGAIKTITFIVQGLIVVFGHVVDAIKYFTDVFLLMLGTIVHQAAIAFGWIPGIGPKLKEAASKFDEFAASVRAKLDSLNNKTVDVHVKVHVSDTGVKGLIGGGKGINIIQAFAEGGTPDPRFPALVGEEGPEVLYRGTVYPLGPGRTPSPVAGGAGDILGVVVVRHEKANGEHLRDELLTLKRRRGPGFQLGLS